MEGNPRARHVGQLPREGPERNPAVDDALQARPDLAEGVPPGDRPDALGQDQQPTGNPGDEGEIARPRPLHDGLQLGGPVRDQGHLAAGLIEVPFRPRGQVERRDAAQIAADGPGAASLGHRTQCGGSPEKEMASPEDPGMACPDSVEEKRVEPRATKVLQQRRRNRQILGAPRRGAGRNGEMTTGARPKDVGLAALHPIDPRPKLLVAAGRDGPPVRFPHFRVEAVLAAEDRARPAPAQLADGGPLPGLRLSRPIQPRAQPGRRHPSAEGHQPLHEGSGSSLHPLAGGGRHAASGRRCARRRA